MTNKILIKQKTIVMTIGISNCGKSFFCENHLIPFLKSHKINYKYLSSDNIRKELLDNNSLHKHSKIMLQVSSQAFSILENQLDNYTQYPINTDVIIVDSTALTKLGREYIYKYAKKNNYKIIGLMFDYRKRDDYFKYSENTNKNIIREHLTTFREKTIKEIERKEFETIYKISSTEFENYNFCFEETGIVEHPDTSKFDRYCIVGDVHGCLDELIECVSDNKGLVYNESTGLLSIENQEKYHHHILVGDFVDKGSKILETIKFIYDNRQFFWIVKGNHENFVYKFLKGELGTYEKNKNLIDNYFDSILLLKDNEEYKKMFFELVEQSFDFVSGENFIVTHAPCENKYLGKTDKNSVKAQRTIVYPKQADFENKETYIKAKEEFFKFLLDDANIILPFHFFGHVSVKEVFSYKNKFNLDTGCVSGNKLSCASINIGQKRPFIKSYESKQKKKDDLDLMFTLKPKDISFSNLESEVKGRLHYAAENKLNFISGTMSPCDKSPAELENLFKGIEYYKDKVDKIILQPKYMGSRCTVHLHKNDPDKTKYFSRQGYEIKEERLSNSTKTLLELTTELQMKYKYLFDELNADAILFDGELLPWTVMGKTLIEKDFKTPSKAIGIETSLLKESGFESKLSEFKDKFLQKDRTELKPHEVKYIDWYNEFKKEFQALDQVSEDLQKYNTQLDIFTADGITEFKPFSILKVFKTNGDEENWVSEIKSNIEIFNLLNKFSEPFSIIDFKESSTFLNLGDGTSFTFYYKNEKELSFQLNQFWAFITEDKKMEGVVIKPEEVYKVGIAPYLKCRNTEYLRLIYGVDYDSLMHKYIKLIEKKSIKNKLNTSIKEWVLGKKLLDIKSKDISVENTEWLNIMLQLIDEQESEKTLDPRL